MRIDTASFVLPIISDPIADGAVAVDGERIAAVGKLRDVQRTFPGATIVDHGDAAILPGFVNCHSHLEITAMRGSLDAVEHDFRSWLLKLNDLRRSLGKKDILTAAVAGAAEGARAGVTCFGDVGRHGVAGLEALKAVGLRGIVFQETEFAPDDRTAAKYFRKLLKDFERLRSSQTGLVEIGISPHSPYTVGAEFFRRIAELSIREKIKLTVHAAESRDEIELLNDGTGFFSDIYKRFGFHWDSPLCSPIEYLDRLGVLEARPLLAHCIRVTPVDIQLIARSGSSIAHCPKSNAKFGHGAAPLETFVDMNIAVGLGSDSVASNNLCDMLEEGRFAALTARNRTGSSRSFSAKDVLHAATLGGAKALGLDHDIGSLEIGKQADLTVISLTNIAQLPVHDVHTALVFASGARDVTMTIVAGQEIYRNGRLTMVDENELTQKLLRMSSM